MLLASIGMADFNTKGEPREVAVAHAMLTQGNWILPIDGAGDMAYKPPMFHWLVAAFSWALGCMTEFSCRLPSALALVALAAMTFLFFAPCRSTDGSNCRAAMLTALFTLTAFECYRAGTNCRVDMVLTAFMCGAMMSLCKAVVTRRMLFYVVGALCMSGAALTKGPVGIVLPLATYFVFALLRGRNFFIVCLISLLLLAVSALLPALYYYAAWKQGGQRFLALVMEENFGRMTGRMTYESHSHTWFYNVTSLLLGWLPWTLSAAAAAVWAWLRCRKMTVASPCCETKGHRSFRERLRAADPERQFTLVAMATVFLFYSLPDSKRSVYLLPMYPFMAYWLTCYVKWLMRRCGLRIGVMGGVMAAVCVMYPVAYGICFPLAVNGKSDRHIAVEVSRRVPDDEPVYTFVPDRALRYYITDHYLGYRMRSLLPSGQVDAGDKDPDANDIMRPGSDSFYMAVSSTVWNGVRTRLGQDSYDRKSDYGLHAWLQAHGLSADVVYVSDTKTHDVRGRLVLLHVHKTDTRKL